MSKIKALLGEKTFELIPESPDKILQNFLGIDSLHVVLGRNGSGKTHLLTSIARSFGPSEGPLSVLVEDEMRFERRLIGKQEKRAYGVVFFTSLPYRRKIRQSVNVLDVSPSPSQRDLIGEVDVFRRVCSDLNLHTSLRGYVGYSSSIFSELLLPAILASSSTSDYRLSPRGRNALLFLSDPDRSKEGYERAEEHLLAAREDLLEELRQFFKAGEHSLQRLAELAVLQTLASRSKQATPLAAAYLGMIGFSNRGSFSGLDNAFLAEYHEMVDRTLVYLHTQDLDHHGRNELSFEIRSETEAEDIARAKSAVRIGWSDLSSGMRALVEQFSQLRRGVEKLRNRAVPNILILLDEGDAYLHLDWQRRYIQMLDRFLTSLKQDLNIRNIQVVLATHSPVIASDLPSWMITSLDDGVLPKKTFAAPIDEVISDSFGSTSIGAFAAEKINELHCRLSNDTATETDHALLEEVGDFMIKNALLRAQKNGNRS